ETEPRAGGGHAGGGRPARVLRVLHLARGGDAALPQRRVSAAAGRARHTPRAAVRPGGPAVRLVGPADGAGLHAPDADDGPVRRPRRDGRGGPFTPAGLRGGVGRMTNRAPHLTVLALVVGLGLP